ncbi:MAG: hypothetical protein KF730_16325 [Sphingomonas sp.]|uniref:hypothetical protein n=1 Tax=Sphingomonas sp. TaxID=28214 RepID=UPI0025FE853B|nr:hypothetical protein [Sphingomonas sp.]MBX3566127.1 hypothetical protein [Sphingomonas sp.]
MHLELLPIWFLPLIAVVASALLVSFVWVRVKARRRKQRQHERRRKNIAHARAWDWVMGRRAPRLTDQRSVPE